MFDNEVKSSKMSITDPVHGSIPLTCLQECLIQTVELQRLNAIHQLGMTYQVYPGAHSMRFSHALGVSHIASQIGRSLVVENEEIILDDKTRDKSAKMITAAGLLHDIGHTPWSHALEPLLLQTLGRNHMQLTHDLITGRMQMKTKGAGRIPAILLSFGLSPVEIADLVIQAFQAPKYLQQIIFGEVDADMMDYLGRDFHFTGVSFGHIDIIRLIQTMIIQDDVLCFKDKGLSAVRDFLNARIEMYSAVYLHKKTRIADIMLLRAASESIVERKEFPSFWQMTDDELLSAMLNDSKSEYVREMSWRLKYRQGLFKRVYNIEAAAMSPRQKNFVCRIASLKHGDKCGAPALEAIIADKTGISPKHVIVDIVTQAVELSEQRFKEIGIFFVDKNRKILKLRDLDPNFADYIARAFPSRAALSIYTSEENLSRLSDCISDIVENCF